MNVSQVKNIQNIMWNLSHADQQGNAKDFISFFENKLCIFSASVNKIYTNYSFSFPEGRQREMVVLPNRYVFHDTLNNVPASAIMPTGLHIIPGSRINKKEPYMVFSHIKPVVKSTPIPFREGIKVILDRLHTDNPFLPILTTGDLRSFDNKTPSLHLNRLHIDKLTSLSQFQREDIKQVITKNIAKLYLDAAKTFT
jgi:hypothetical protein